MERLYDLLSEVKVYGAVVVIAATVYILGWSQQMEEKAASGRYLGPYRRAAAVRAVQPEVVAGESVTPADY